MTLDRQMKDATNIENEPSIASSLPSVFSWESIAVIVHCAETDSG